MKTRILELLKRYYIPVCTVILALISLLITHLMIVSIRNTLTGTGYENKTTGMAYPAVATADSSDTGDGGTAPSPSSEEYILREYEGRIGVFTEGATAPFLMIQVYVDTLPSSDREMLRGGIPVTGQLELYRMMAELES